VYNNSVGQRLLQTVVGALGDDNLFPGGTGDLMTDERRWQRQSAVFFQWAILGLGRAVYTNVC
jgi:hypothetical protein